MRLYVGIIAESNPGLRNTRESYLEVTMSHLDEQIFKQVPHALTLLLEQNRNKEGLF